VDVDAVPTDDACRLILDPAEHAGIRLRVVRWRSGSAVEIAGVEMPVNPMDPATAVIWGPFVQAAYDQFVSDPGESNPSSITNLPPGYTLVRTIQMSDFIGPTTSRVFYGYIAVGGDPPTAVVALRGTSTAVEWWDDLHWNLVPFTRVSNGGKVAQGFYDIYNTFGTSVPADQGSAPASTTFAGDVADAAAQGLSLDLDPTLPVVVCGHSLGGALATLLVADLGANTPPKPQAWTFASPRVGDATFAARYGALSGVSWRIYNQVDVIPYFPVDTSDSYQPVTTGYAINSLPYARWSLGCCHALNTYLHVLSPNTVPLDSACQPTG
jgi:triacylglycerol lipase